jgi:ATP-binding cassette subfamily B protein
VNFSKPLSFPRALLIPFRIAPLETVVHIINSVIWIILAPVRVLVTAYFIDAALTAIRDGTGFSGIILPLAFIIAIGVYGDITGPLFSLLRTRCMIKMRLALRVPMMQKRVRLEYKHIETPKTVDLLNRVWGNPDQQISGMLDNILGFISLVGTVGAYIVILIINAPVAGIALVVLSVPMFWLADKAGKANYQAFKEATQDERYHGNFSWNLTTRYTAAERNLFGYARYMHSLFLKHYEAARKHRLKTEALWFVRSKASSLLLWLLAAGGLFIMAPGVASGTLTVGLFISLQAMLFSTVNWVGWSLPYHFQELTRHKEYLKEFNQFFALSDIEGAEDLPNPSPLTFETLEFKDVTFSYPGMEKVVLQNLSLKMEAGKHYAFVGINGAGKTTITKLLTRLYDDYSGEILLNGKPLREWAVADVKACFCALFQDFAQYDITVAENVTMGKIGGASSDEVDNALTLSGFDGKAAELKNGKDTLLGKTHEDGIDLSGGQWQRLAFARAIVSPAPIKILDEPTASLDPVAESQMYAQFEQISRGFTTIFISHRLASAKMANEIFVLENGTVAEKGSHAELMAQKGLYAEMFETQRGWYL